MNVRLKSSLQSSISRIILYVMINILYFICIINVYVTLHHHKLRSCSSWSVGLRLLSNCSEPYALSLQWIPIVLIFYSLSPTLPVLLLIVGFSISPFWYNHSAIASMFTTLCAYQYNLRLHHAVPRMLVLTPILVVTFPLRQFIGSDKLS